MLADDIRDEVRYGIDDISRRGMRMFNDDGDEGRRSPAWRLAGSGPGPGGGQGIDLFSLLFAWFDALAGLAGTFLALLRRI